MYCSYTFRIHNKNLVIVKRKLELSFRLQYTTVGDRQEWDCYTKSWPVDPLLLGSCMLQHWGKAKNETIMASKLRKLMELWLKECHKHEAEQKRTITNDIDINGRRKKFVKRSKEKVKRRRNGDGWKKRQLEGWKR